jgi:Dyp-type peroxidase family
MEIDLGNLQGVVKRVYPYPICRHLLFHFGDSGNARAFLTQLLPQVTQADNPLQPKPDALLNLGLSYTGLVALGIDQGLLTQFDALFKSGPDPGELGDVAGSRSDPQNWWERQFTTDHIHGVVHLYALSDAAMDAVSARVRTLLSRFGITELIPRQSGVPLEGRSLGDRRLHFGYRDGFSHPDVAWSDDRSETNELSFRHFVLGYSDPEIPSAPATGAAAELVRDSSYVAFRWIYQDVAAFNRFLSREGPTLAPHLPPGDAEELLAAKLMGRWRNGTPLVLSPDRPVPDQSANNDFTYARDDAHGLRCPFSAHIRVVNPRDQALDPVIVEPVPRVLRRGMPYGAELQGSEDDGEDRGIIGMFVCTDIRRQFNTLGRWIKRNNFSPVFDGNRRVQDPLFANRSVPGTLPEFTIPTDNGPVTLGGLPDFIHTKGTAFFLLPSISTLRALAGGP